MTAVQLANWLFGYLVALGLVVAVAAGTAFAAWSLGVASRYGWRRLQGAHDLMVLSLEMHKLAKAGRLWQFKPDDVQ